MMPECARSPACLRATADATVEGRFALAWQDRERFVATMKKDWMPDSIAPPKPSYNGVRDELALAFPLATSTSSPREMKRGSCLQDFGRVATFHPAFG